MIYLDSAALVKLARTELHSADLVEWLDNRSPGESLAASSLVQVEVPRALRRSAPGRLRAVPGILSSLHLIEMTPVILATAAAYEDPNLRSLDAIHLATVEVLIQHSRTVTAFVAYDKRLLDAAEAIGLPVAAPGLS
ncbi:type II toxin-antitoxin system VapC family toxin [Marinitenerispora sediminis]|uniref:Ribonuclease VapC n=1 Tax=Marinitenerispora sediminis TaxID=1931232 RepID=A0A368T9R5_9ACTN|nr:type II toxin-antitoxin system VapC family toxin [Marinitenerispora sediminis]RCV53827.1 VapC toxin family PIN domain ribonuclease [Marinitenerispora sediminis]RCV58227.1 VapC toxin family PIN domain ribonuclease [Marinitenerispora sediminis]RCV61477.1 VapC toxin family PIN domain ribonuclease [Marinitenerispora sediminis]